jgi:hypothetical protein
MGVSEECAIGQYFKRLLVIESVLGTADYHVRRFAALVEGVGGEGRAE